MALDFPENLEPFEEAKVPTEEQLKHAKLMKLLMLGLTAALPVIGLLVSIPYLQLLPEGALLISAVAIPFAILALMAAVFAYSNMKYGTALQNYAAWNALLPVLENLAEKPSSILIAPTSVMEAAAAGGRVKEFVMRFPSAPGLNIYYYDGSVNAGLARFTGKAPESKGLRLRAYAPLRPGKPGRFERYGTIYLPQWGFTDDVSDLAKIRKKVDISGMNLVSEDPEPSRIEFTGKHVLVVLSLKQGAHKQVWKAAQALAQVMGALADERVI